MDLVGELGRARSVTKRGARIRVVGKNYVSTVLVRVVAVGVGELTLERLCSVVAGSATARPPPRARCTAERLADRRDKTRQTPAAKARSTRFAPAFDGTRTRVAALAVAESQHARPKVGRRRRAVQRATLAIGEGAVARQVYVGVESVGLLVAVFLVTLASVAFVV